MVKCENFVVGISIKIRLRIDAVQAVLVSTIVDKRVLANTRVRNCLRRIIVSHVDVHRP